MNPLLCLGLFDKHIFNLHQWLHQVRQEAHLRNLKDYQSGNFTGTKPFLTLNQQCHSNENCTNLPFLNTPYSHLQPMVLFKIQRQTLNAGTSYKPAVPGFIISSSSLKRTCELRRRRFVTVFGTSTMLPPIAAMRRLCAVLNSVRF